jgi:hypothetical protein
MTSENAECCVAVVGIYLYIILPSKQNSCSQGGARRGALEACQLGLSLALLSAQAFHYQRAAALAKPSASQ